MKKVMQVLFAVLVAASFLVSPAEARQVKAKQKATMAKTVNNADDQVALEAAWIAGGKDYQAAVNKAADAYAEKMNARCQGFVDTSAAVKVYNVYTLPGAEAERNRLVKIQIVSLACATMYGDGLERAARLRM